MVSRYTARFELDGAAQDATGVPDPDVSTTEPEPLGRLVKLAPLNVGADWYVGGPAPPVGGPASTVLGAALDRVKDSTGDDVGADTEVVKRGLKVPAAKFVRVPDPADPTLTQSPACVQAVLLHAYKTPAAV